MDLRCLVVKGKFLVNFGEKDYGKQLLTTRDLLIDFFKGMGYQYTGPFTLRNFMSMEFLLTNLYTERLNLIEKIWSKLGLLSKEKIDEKIYFRNLYYIKPSFPTQLKIHMYIEPKLGGIVVEVTSIPGKYLKITQLKENAHLTEEEYSAIIFENETFIEEICRALHGTFLETPKPKIEWHVETNLTKKLVKFGFKNINKLLKESKNKMEIGKFKECADDLRRVVENFMYELISKLDEKPYSRDKPEKNLEKLERLGYIDGKTKGLIRSSLINGVYRLLSDVAHGREQIDLFTARLCYNLTESVLDNLIERVVKYRIKTTDKNKQ